MHPTLSKPISDGSPGQKSGDTTYQESPDVGRSSPSKHWENDTSENQMALPSLLSRDLVSWSWWWTGRPGVLRFMGSQRVGHDWATELNWCTGNSQKTPPWTQNQHITGWALSMYLFSKIAWCDTRELLRLPCLLKNCLKTRGLARKSMEGREAGRSTWVPLSLYYLFPNISASTP